MAKWGQNGQIPSPQGVMVGEELNVNFKYAVIFFEQLIIMNSSNKTDQNKNRRRKDPPSTKGIGMNFCDPFFQIKCLLPNINFL